MRGGGLGGFGGVLRVRVLPVQREVAVAETHPVAQFVAHLTDHRMSAGAIRALVVTVLHDLQRRVARSLHVIAGVKRIGELRRFCADVGHTWEFVARYVTKKSAHG